VPAITLDIAPLNEIVRAGEEGLFFKENDPEDLARVIASLADDRPGREAMGRKARERAPRFSWAAHAEEIESILKGLKAA
jgi:phosphatidylinositol alpha-mannosyltransferase